MNLETQREQAHQLCRDHGITVHAYANVWWLLGHGINRVVGELAGLCHTDLQRLEIVPR